jgi:hypothetical protein
MGLIEEMGVIKHPLLVYKKIRGISFDCYFGLTLHTSVKKLMMTEDRKKWSCSWSEKGRKHKSTSHSN